MNTESQTNNLLPEVTWVDVDSIQLSCAIELSRKPDEMAALKSSVQQFNIKTPVELTTNLEIVNGMCRVMVAKELGHDKVPAIIREYKSELDKVRTAIISNSSRKKTKLDYVKSALKYRELIPKAPGKRTDRDGGTKYDSTQEIADLLMIHKRTLQSLMRIHQFCPDLLTSKLSTRHAETFISMATDAGHKSAASLEDLKPIAHDLLGGLPPEGDDSVNAVIQMLSYKSKADKQEKLARPKGKPVKKLSEKLCLPNPELCNACTYYQEHFKNTTHEKEEAVHNN